MIEPVEGLEYYRLNQYFYVTEDTIYRLLPYYFDAKENEMVTFYEDELFVEVLDTDDKLKNEGDIVCQKEEIESSLEEKQDDFDGFEAQFHGLPERKDLMYVHLSIRK